MHYGYHQTAYRVEPPFANHAWGSSGCKEEMWDRQSPRFIQHMRLKSFQIIVNCTAIFVQVIFVILHSEVVFVKKIIIAGIHLMVKVHYFYSVIFLLNFCHLLHFFARHLEGTIALSIVSTKHRQGQDLFQGTLCQVLLLSAPQLTK